MTVKLKDKKTGDVVIEIENVQSISVDIDTETIEIAIPGEGETEVMSIGGVIRRVAISWIDDVENVGKIMYHIITGEMLKTYELTITEWQITKDAVVKKVSVRQRAGQPKVVEANMVLVIGRSL